MLNRVRNWYARYERPVSSLFLIGGFALDALTIRAVDLYWQNIWIAANLTILGICIVLINALERQEGDEANSAKAHFWLVNILQFFFGSTLSTFMVFYFNSSDLSVSWPFLLVLAISFWANETFKRKYVRLTFQISFYFLAIFSFAIFLIPYLFHHIGQGMFLISGAASLVVITLFLLIVRFFSKREFSASKKILIPAILGIFILINIFYFKNFIPPIPISLKDSGVYHSLKRNSQGGYDIKTEEYSWKEFFNPYQDIHITKGKPVYVYSAIFSPPAFKMEIYHQWEQYNPDTKEWIFKDRIRLQVVGGRKGGFRTYSLKTNPAPGRWRVNVLTDRGQLIGRIRFDVVNVDMEPKLEQKIN